MRVSIVSGRFGISTTTPTFGQATPITTYDPKLGVEGSIIIGNLSATASDRSELQFYRRAGSAIVNQSAITTWARLLGMDQAMMQITRI